LLTKNGVATACWACMGELGGAALSWRLSGGVVVQAATEIYWLVVQRQIGERKRRVVTTVGFQEKRVRGRGLG
jgi:hypothetical protein